MQTESEVLRGCLELLKVNNIYAWRNNTGAIKKGNVFIRYGKKGSSDIIGICPNGKFLAIECKTKKGILSPEQNEFLSNIEKNGGVALIVRQVEELEKEIKKII